MSTGANSNTEAVVRTGALMQASASVKSRSGLVGRRVLHVTTADISLALLLGPQLKAFSDSGMEVIGLSAPGPFVEQVEALGVRHIALRHATRSIAPWHDLQALFELVRLLRLLRPDIVHTHNPKPGLYGRIAARIAGVPVVVNTVHGLYASPDDSFARRAIVYLLERMASVCSDCELVQNPEDIGVLGRLRVPKDKLVLLGNGVDLTRFRPAVDAQEKKQARSALGLGDDQQSIVVGMVGRLVWEKGLRELFEAACILRDSHPKVQIVIVGPADPAKADALTEDDIDEARRIGNVVFVGHRDDIDKLYAGFDMFALPSHREGFPRSAMEAAACAVPVIATDIRGCRQVVEHGVNGLLVPLYDARALALAIGRLADDPGERAQMAQAARAKAEAEFDDQAVIQTTLSVYESCVRKARRISRTASRAAAPL